MRCHPGRECLAQGPACVVERCECGTLHVTIGTITARMDAGVLAALVPTLAEALGTLEQRELFEVALRNHQPSGQPS